MRNRMYGGVRGRKTKVGEKLLRFPHYSIVLSMPITWSLSARLMGIGRPLNGL